MASTKSEIICVIDRSGSMGTMAKEAIGGFNSFLAEQKGVPDDDCKFTLVLFDHDYQKIYDAENIELVGDLNEHTYIPRGMTALYDSLGRALDEAMDRIQVEYSEKPRIAVMVMTDGQENASKDYTKARLTELVDKLKADGWQFTFMSSDLSSFDKDLGQMTVGTMSLGYNATGKGYSNSYAMAGSNVRNFRSSNVFVAGSIMMNDDGSTQDLKIKARKDDKKDDKTVSTDPS